VNSFARLTNFFGLKRNLVILLIAIFVIGAGEELWMRFVPKYLQSLGAMVFVIGLYDALRTLLGAIYAYPGGVLADRWGPAPDQKRRNHADEQDGRTAGVADAERSRAVIGQRRAYGRRRNNRQPV
jgi:MFS family permease